MNVYLVDGNSFFYRAFHAIKSLTNSKGFPTNAIYGFTTMLMKILKEKKPDALAIAFDSKEPTGRRQMYEQYKAHRPETPGDLILQIPRIKEVIAALRIPTFEMPGYEADDIIATLARHCAARKANVFILTGDKDMMQAVNDRIRIYDPMKDVVIDTTGVVERFGVPPARVPEVMALMGDAVDNIPGVKGIGEKTAKDLIQKAGNLDALLADPDRYTTPRIAALIQEQIDSVHMSRTLATINADVPVSADPGDFTLQEPDWPALLELFAEFEFRSLLKQVPAAEHNPRARYEAITDKNALLDFLGEPA
ncbi:MAG TPA: 5'-3' exonuclease H3TH domain-containing protein [Dissulfurispiraceae bacterium]|nr:5'-3' exonuclease H3TH domain-containing protein [Dissulfurispiraceae bacterium]